MSDLITDLAALLEARKDTVEPISQADVARAVCVGQPSVSYWLKRANNPSGPAEKLLRDFVSREAARAVPSKQDAERAA